MAVIKGMLDLRPDNGIKGVILNNIRRETYEGLAPVIKKETGITPLGFFPHDESLVIGSRHLGLLTPDELSGINDTVERLGALAEECLPA